MGDMVKIKLYVNTGYPSAKHEDVWEVDREWWESLSEKKKKMSCVKWQLNTETITLSAERMW